MKYIRPPQNWDYLLRAEFSGANTGAMANGADIETQSGGSVPEGALTVVDPGSGSVEVLSNELVIKGSTPFGLSGVIGEDIAVARGRVLIMNYKHTGSMSGHYSRVGWHEEAILGDTYPKYTVVNIVGTWQYQGDGVGINIKTISLNEVLYAAIMLGGYDSSGIPWNGSDSGFSYGGACFWNDGSNWKLLYRAPGTDYGTLAPAFENAHSTAAINFAKANIPQVDLSHLLKPLVLDTFTDTNGTALTSHTPDVDVVGGGWQVLGAGIWGISSDNRLRNTNSDGLRYVAAIETNKSDIFAEVILTTKSSGNTSAGLNIRCSDETNQWRIYCQSSSSKFSIQENIAGSVTIRVDVTKTFSAGTDYRITCAADGSTINAWVDDGSAISYSSATFNQTETEHGVLEYEDLSGSNPHYDNFAIYPIGSNGEYNDLDRY